MSSIQATLNWSAKVVSFSGNFAISKHYKKIKSKWIDLSDIMNQTKSFSYKLYQYFVVSPLIFYTYNYIFFKVFASDILLVIKDIFKAIFEFKMRIVIIYCTYPHATLNNQCYFSVIYILLLIIKKLFWISFLFLCF